MAMFTKLFTILFQTQHCSDIYVALFRYGFSSAINNQSLLLVRGLSGLILIASTWALIPYFLLRSLSSYAL